MLERGNSARMNKLINKIYDYVERFSTAQE